MSIKAVPRVSPKKIAAFREAVWDYYKAHGRQDLPWRKTSDPYRILVSEVMLQQTQVSRVIEKYKEFLIRFPNARRLAEAPLSDVLRAWSGLGYNRRAKYLKAAAEVIVRGYGGRVPKASIVLRTIPGIGPYTASAVRVFAFNEPDVLIETNVRAAFIHYFFGDTSILSGRPKLMGVTDKQLLPFIENAAECQDPRTWQWALMDYGVYIKKLHGNPARRSAHYTRQSKFEGSLRQVRGEILRQLMKGNNGLKGMLPRPGLGNEREKWEKALAGLAKDGLIRKEKGRWMMIV